jgi:integrase/recombinase XerD
VRASHSRSFNASHANLGITAIYLQGIDNSEIISTVHARPAPMCPPAQDLR